MSDLGDFVTQYLQRAVNGHDLGAVDELVDPAYRGSGHGWPEDVASLRAFYAWQHQERPDWRIEVQETVELGDSVAVRATAGGTAGGARRDVEWLATYRIKAGRILEIRVLALQER